MDVSKLNTKKGASKGAFLHLSHPALGHKLWTGEGADDEGRGIDRDKAEKVGLMVIGLESERARQRAREFNKKRMQRNDGDSDADEQEGLEFVCSLVTECVGLTSAEGKALTTSHDDLHYLFEQSDDFAQQVLAFAQDRANFYKAGSQT